MNRFKDDTIETQHIHVQLHCSAAENLLEAFLENKRPSETALSGLFAYLVVKKPFKGLVNMQTPKEIQDYDQESLAFIVSEVSSVMLAIEEIMPMHLIELKCYAYMAHLFRMIDE